MILVLGVHDSVCHISQLTAGGNFMDSDNMGSFDYACADCGPCTRFALGDFLVQHGTNE